MAQEQLFAHDADPVGQAATTGAANPPADAAGDATIIVQVYAAARAIPVGKVMSYGSLGARCEPPISGYICGRIMNQASDDVPWWRVVAKDGSLPIRKRSPQLALTQQRRLESEGVAFDSGGCVRRDCFVE